MNEWDDAPKWVKEGRTGPNGPRYTSGKDRRKVRQDFDSGGYKAPPNKDDDGGCLRIIAIPAIVLLGLIVLICIV